MSIATANELLNFWFSDRVRPLWFNSTPEFDAELRRSILIPIVQRLMVNCHIGQQRRKARWPW